MMKGMAIRRDRSGRVLPGSMLNPSGRNQYAGRAEQFANRARALLDRSVSAEELSEIGVSDAARRWLPEDATLADALVVVMVAAALGGDHYARRDLLARVWPTPKIADLAEDGLPRTLAEFVQLAREEEGEQVAGAP
jgi:hypothetical protein